ncbi:MULTISPECIES: hypothetical protein [Microcystis]|uniref:hypothetical protein n=1 Tax=Microcystis TaxID=1125 RepID=UPI001F558B09|nr:MULTISPECIES: hypothetical protein [Microcystis]
MDDLDTDVDDTTDDNSEDSSFSWNDSCQYIDGDQELLWKTEFGLTSFNNNGEPIFVCYSWQYYLAATVKYTWKFIAKFTSRNAVGLCYFKRDSSSWQSSDPSHIKTTAFLIKGGKSEDYRFLNVCFWHFFA